VRRPSAFSPASSILQAVRGLPGVQPALALLGIRGVAVLVSLALSVWSVYRDPVINNDGILYLSAAAAFLAGDWRGAFALYPWPFYSWLIALTHLGTGFAFEHCAHLLNALFQAATVWAFITVVKELGADRRVMAAAALVILLHPGLNEYRPFVVRDFGYWAFYLLALLWLLRFFKRPSTGSALAWGGVMVAATLFRIEGLVILVLLPLALLFQRDVAFPTRLGRLGTAQLVTLAVLAVLLGWVLLGHSIETSRLTEPAQWLQQFWRQLAGGFQQKASALSQAILNKYSMGYAVAGVLAVLVVILVTKLVVALSPLYALLALHAWRGRLVPTLAENGRVLGWLVLLQTTMVAGFLANHFFVTGRYPMALALTIMLLAPFSLVALYDGWRENQGAWRRRRWLFPAVCAVLLWMAVDGLYSFGASKTYLRDAGLWLEERTPPEARLHSNSKPLTFYAGKRERNWARGFNWDETAQLVQDGSWRSYDYLAIAIDRKHPERLEVLQAALGREPVARFVNNRGDQALIFSTR